MSQSAVEALFAERWTDVCGLVDAFFEFENRALESFENEVGNIVRSWLAEQGYEMNVNAKYAEFNAFKTGWVKADGPVVRLTVGGLFPRGLAKVDTRAPYLWVYVKADKPVRTQIAERLTRGADPVWLDPEVKDTQPLGQYLSGGDRERFDLVRNPRAMAAFVTEQYPRLLALDPQINAVLRAVGVV